jgi:hypothetical protein
LILTYPQSALVPQARRELEIAKGVVPPVDKEFVLRGPGIYGVN